MGLTGELKAFNRVFKEARAVDSEHKIRRLFGGAEGGDAGDLGEGGDVITGAAIGTKRTTRLLRGQP
jgi:hypothetical protein